MSSDVLDLLILRASFRDCSCPVFGENHRNVCWINRRYHFLKVIERIAGLNAFFALIARWAASTFVWACEKTVK
jgi:hypothetical protein